MKFNFSPQKTRRLLVLPSVFLYLLIDNVIKGLLFYQFYPTLDMMAEQIVYVWVGFFIIFRLMAVIRAELDKTKPWENNPLNRFISQSFYSILLAGGIQSLLAFMTQYFRFSVLGEATFISFQLALIQFFITAFVIQINVLIEFGQNLLQRWHTSEMEAERFEKEKAEFQLEMLKTQINPHFLFNNLNTLSSLVYESQDKASSFVRQLSAVFRNILDRRTKDAIPLDDELEIFSSYRNLMAIRFENVLSIDLRIPDTALKKKVIPLTLQLLVENAIKHNIASKNKPLSIKIFVYNNYIFVSNNLQLKQQKEYSSGLGLQIINNRYAFLTDKKVEIFKDERIFRVGVPLL